MVYGNFFMNLSSIISEKCTCYPQFSFRILTALGKIWFFHIDINRQNTFVLAGEFRKKLEYLGPGVFFLTAPKLFGPILAR